MENKTTTSSSLPVKTTIENAIQVSIGDGHVSALTSDGVLWAWGRNSSGGLGINSTNNNTTYPMKTILNVTEVSNGGYHTIVKKVDGTLYACRSIYLWKTWNRKHIKCNYLYKSKFTKYSDRYK
jgi:alpha-tubulin suppressor-like RCC1 family protein